MKRWPKIIVLDAYGSVWIGGPASTPEGMAALAATATGVEVREYALVPKPKKRKAKR